MFLDVIIEGVLAGRAELRGARDAAFSYVSSYLDGADRTPLSVRYPLREDPYKGPDVAYWLENLLPDDNYVRQQWCSDYGVEQARALELLGTEVGSECAGAVQFCEPDKTERLLAETGGVEEITVARLWAGLRELRRNPAFRFATAYGAAGRSTAGMQPKDALAWTGGRWAVPWGNRPTTHIVKVERPQFPHEALVEHATLSLARQLGLAAAESHVLHGDEFDAIAVRRYDRRVVAGRLGLQRIHQEDFCQALGLAPFYRNQHLGGATVGDCAEVLDAFGATAPGNLARLQDHVLFRWLVADTDGHAKNVGIMLAGRARALTPLYDAASFLPDRGSTEEPALRFNGIWGGEPGDQWTLGTTDTPRGLTVLAEALRLPVGDVAERAQELAIGIPEAFEQVADAQTIEDQNKLDRLNLVADVSDRARRCETLAGALGRRAAPPRRAATQQPQRPAEIPESGE